MTLRCRFCDAALSRESPTSVYVCTECLLVQLPWTLLHTNDVLNTRF